PRSAFDASTALTLSMKNRYRMERERHKASRSRSVYASMNTPGCCPGLNAVQRAPNSEAETRMASRQSRPA
ncbi:hypothetical protein KUCAC02_034006, partial [Chaenocephalus aceratus]